MDFEKVVNQLIKWLGAAIYTIRYINECNFMPSQYHLKDVKGLTKFHRLIHRCTGLV